MIKIYDCEIKTSLNEFSLKEFEDITAIKNSNQYEDDIDKYIKILEYLKVQTEIIDKIDFDLFLDIVKAFNDGGLESRDMTPIITIDGYNYIAYTDEEFKLKLKDLSIIQKYIKADNNKWIVKTIATIFKREDLSDIENYEPAHIEYKCKLFGDIDVKLVIGYVFYIHEKIANKIKSQIDDK